MMEKSGARPMRSHGDLGTKPLAALIASAAVEGMTGTLCVDDGNRSAAIVFRDGAIATVTTSQAAAQLGLTGDDLAVAESLARAATTLDELGEHALGRARIERLVYFLALARALGRVRIELPTPATLGRAGVIDLAKRIVDDEPHVVL